MTQIREQEVKEKLAHQFYLWDDKPTLDKSHYDMAEDILIIIQQAGYAQLAEDQRLAENPFIAEMNKLFPIFGTVAGICGIVGTALTGNWIALMWAVVATLWAINSWIREA